GRAGGAIATIDHARRAAGAMHITRRNAATVERRAVAGARARAARRTRDGGASTAADNREQDADGNRTHEVPPHGSYPLSHNARSKTAAGSRRDRARPRTATLG